ncbi:hypothetical protein HNV10_11725 [Winogradskyella litoriviva]|uniref:Threonine synthase n=1 Tax=Winogradskyella litoriviva TaxID=1220182 RepID=A0ABX2E758_9FLAO|nr:hypothetical protein [Winogradskyella litoriviva]NRD23917.1 hypothetical protein [Winogradskyella litoriviva]
MKKIVQLLFITITLVACKNETKENKTVIETVKKEDITTSIYPESITKVFNAHGSIETWNKMNTLSFTMVKPDGNEVTTLNLKTRAEQIDTPNYTQGFDGTTLWVSEKDGKEYAGKPKFYKGLMFYFYAMPFVLGDDGIEYKDIEPLVFEGKSYPGILISYEDGIGESSNDQYKIFYDADTGKMEWLGYTVTFGKDGGSDDFHFIRYNNWQTVNGLVVPKSIDWYKYENNAPTEKRNTVPFTNVVLSEEAPNAKLFVQPEGAKLIE